MQPHEHLDPTVWTKNKKLRSPLKRPNITPGRLAIREAAWPRVKKTVYDFLQKAPKGEAQRMARAIGIASSQIHRYTCPLCEHDQEPQFTIGVAMLMYVSINRLTIEEGRVKVVRSRSTGRRTYEYQQEIK